MTREEWIAYHVSRAPKISVKQWAATLLLLRQANRADDDEQDKRKAS